MKLKINADKLRILAEFYEIGMQQLSRKAEIAWTRAGNEFSKTFPITGTDVTVIDVTDDYTPDQWREMINFYCNREIELLPTVLDDHLEKKRIEAEKVRDGALYVVQSPAKSGRSSLKDVARSTNRSK